MLVISSNKRPYKSLTFPLQQHNSFLGRSKMPLTVFYPVSNALQRALPSVHTELLYICNCLHAEAEVTRKTAREKGVKEASVLFSGVWKFVSV